MSMELLAPAGDLKILKSAFAAGADAVYFGGDCFGARVSAAFSETDALTAIEYAHARGKKVYLTVNTLLKNVEMERKLYDFLSVYNRAFVDGIIIQDFGIFSFCRKFFPNLPLHASTQMNIASEYGARFMMEHGATRIVPARELSIEEIAAIHKSLPDLEIEAFLHGALCVCYSGQCLMSSVIGGRSGNRGACAQPCRKKYKALDEGGKVLGEEGYYLSPKDLCGLYALPDLYDAGVISYKIEGRLKNEAYVAGVVSVYRKYFDMIEDHGTTDYSVDEADRKRLLSYGSRGGSTDKYYYLRNDTSMIDPKVGAFRQENDHIDITERKRQVDVKLSVIAGEELSMNVTFGTSTISVTGPIVEAAKNRSTTEDEIREKLIKTGEEAFDIGDLEIEIEGDPFVPMKHVKELRRSAFDTINKLLNKEYFHREVNPYSPVELPDLKRPSAKKLFVSVENISQLEEVKKHDIIDGIYLPERLLHESSLDDDHEFYFRLPTVIRKDDHNRLKKLIDTFKNRLSGIVANSYDALGLLSEIKYLSEKVLFGERLYAFSDRTVAAFYKAGFSHPALPLELNEKELSHRFNHNGTMEIYGRTPVMVMANCPAKRFYGCKKKPFCRIDLTDERGAVFPVVNHCDSCTNYVYNSLPMSLLKDRENVEVLYPANYLISFVFESEKEVADVLFIYRQNYINGKDMDLKEKTTRGHFKRGVK